MPVIFSLLFSGLSKFIGTAFTFLTTKPGVYILMAGIVVGAYWFSGHQGYNRAKAEDKAAYALALAQGETAAANKARNDQLAIDNKMASVSDAESFAAGLAQAKTITLTKGIPIYVTAQTDSTFPVPCGLFRVWRAAEAGDGSSPSAIDLPSGLTDGAACPITASDLADNFIAVAGLYHLAEAKVVGIIALAHALADAAEK